MKKNVKNLDDFLDGAQKNRGAKTARRNRKHLLLCVPCKRESRTNNRVLLYVNEDVYEDLDKYCSGNKQGVINYLLRRALDDLIEKQEIIIEEIC